MEGNATPHWCSFISDSFLHVSANDNSLGPKVLKIFDETINGGHSLSFNMGDTNIVDEGDHKLSGAERPERLSGLKVPNQVDIFSGEIRDTRSYFVLLIYTARGEKILPGLSVHAGRQAIDRDRGETIVGIICQNLIFFDFEYGHKLFENSRNAIAMIINYGQKYVNAY